MHLVRRGLAEILREHGLRASELSDLGKPAGRELQADLVIIVPRAQQHWNVIRGLSQLRDTAPILVLLADPSPAHFRQALECGAAGVLPLESPPTLLLEAIATAVNGQILLPVHVAHELVAPTRELSQLTLNETEGLVLRRLAVGDSVRQIARAVSCSERQAFRLLQRLYDRLEADGRAQALVRAAQLGLLEDTTEKR